MSKNNISCFIENKVNFITTPFKESFKFYDMRSDYFDKIKKTEEKLYT